MITFNKTATLTATLAAALALSACQSTSTTSPVIQRANSTYETTGVSSTKIKAQQNALDKISPVLYHDYLRAMVDEWNKINPDLKKEHEKYFNSFLNE